MVHSVTYSMVQLHILLTCVLCGFSGVDLCFDSLILMDPYGSPLSAVQQVQNYYNRTRHTAIVPLITAILVLSGVSLIRCVLIRRAIRDYIALILFACLLPYFLIYMEPAEDACLGDNVNLSELELRNGLYLVGIGHCAVIVVGTIIMFLEVDWTIESNDKIKKI